MIIKLHEKEIPITKKQAVQIKEALFKGTEWIQVGDEIVNAKYIKGIFHGEEPRLKPFLLTGPKPDYKKIGGEIKKMRVVLRKKGLKL